MMKGNLELETMLFNRMFQLSSRLELEVYQYHSLLVEAIIHFVFYQMDFFWLDFRIE